jgi:hypothetical protein
MDAQILGNAASSALAGATPAASTPTIDLVSMPTGPIVAQALKITPNPILRNPVAQASVLSNAVSKRCNARKVCFQPGFSLLANGTRVTRDALIGESQ